VLSGRPLTRPGQQRGRRTSAAARLFGGQGVSRPAGARGYLAARLSAYPAKVMLPREHARRTHSIWWQHILCGRRRDTGALFRSVSALRARLGTTIRRYREAAGITLEDLAGRAGVHRNYVGLVERGRVNVSVETLARLLTALDIALGPFFAAVDAAEITGAGADDAGGGANTGQGS